MVRTNVADIQDELAYWLLQQPEASVAQHVLFGEAIVLAKGDVMAALGTLWNLFSRNWYAAPTRQLNRYVTKMIDPTGEAAIHDGTGRYIVKDSPNGTKTLQFVISKRGDVFSTYYHFWGTMFLSSYVSSKYKSGLAGSAIARLGIFLENYFYTSTSGLEIERRKRIDNDIEGARAGAAIRGMVRKQTSLPATTTSDSPSYYLKSDPKYATEYPLENDGGPPAYYGSTVDPSYWQKDFMSVDELVLRVEYAVNINSLIINPFVPYIELKQV